MILNTSGVVIDIIHVVFMNSVVYNPKISIPLHSVPIKLGHLSLYERKISWIKDNIRNPNLNNSILLKNANLNNSVLLKNPNLNNSVLLKNPNLTIAYC